jgi:inner membrane protein
MFLRTKVFITVKYRIIDSLTHIVLGACIGEALAGKKIGKRAMLWGALAQSIPDIDFISAAWNGTASNLLAHRGFTHSILFAFIATLFFALFAAHYHRKHRVGYKHWLAFFGIQIGVHLFIDLLNSYGMGLFEPFSHRRYSLNTIFVADPFFSVWPAIGFVALLVLKKNDSRRKTWRQVGIWGSAIYLFYCCLNKIKIDRDVEKIFASKQIDPQRYITTPTPLNNWLWYVVAQKDSVFYVGYRSVYDRSANMDLLVFPKNDSLLRPLLKEEELQHLLRFSQGYYTVEKWHDTLVFNDLRFGQMIGWQDSREKFVFHYFLQMPGSNKLVVQRGRFAKWNWQTTRTLLKRIGGKN